MKIVLDEWEVLLIEVNNNALDCHSSLKENSPHNVCQIYIKPYSEHIKIAVECQIFVWKALDYARHISPLLF